jgi:hypothetical protein
MKVREVIRLIEQDGWRLLRLVAAIGNISIRSSLAGSRSPASLPMILPPVL